MKQLTLNGHTLLICPVPDLATELELFYSIEKVGKIMFTNQSGKRVIDTLPPGSWQIIGPGLASEIKEEHVPEGLVDEDEFFDIDDADLADGAGEDYHPELGYENYEPYGSMCYTRLASLLSFLRANGYGEGNKIVLLISKK